MTFSQTFLVGRLPAVADKQADLVNLPCSCGSLALNFGENGWLESPSGDDNRFNSLVTDSRSHSGNIKHLFFTGAGSRYTPKSPWRAFPRRRMPKPDARGNGSQIREKQAVSALRIAELGGRYVPAFPVARNCPASTLLFSSPQTRAV